MSAVHFDHRTQRFLERLKLNHFYQTNAIVVSVCICLSQFAFVKQLRKNAGGAQRTNRLRWASYSDFQLIQCWRILWPIVQTRAMGGDLSRPRQGKLLSNDTLPSGWWKTWFSSFPDFCKLEAFEDGQAQTSVNINGCLQQHSEFFRSIVVVSKLTCQVLLDAHNLEITHSIFNCCVHVSGQRSDWHRQSKVLRWL